jgi:predicted heme/steroid binding protein
MIYTQNDFRIQAERGKPIPKPESGPKGRWIYFVMDGTVVDYAPMSVEWGDRFLANPAFTSRTEDGVEIVEMHVNGEVFDLQLSEMWTALLLSEPEIVLLPFWTEDGEEDFFYSFVGHGYKWDGSSFYYDKVMSDGSIKRFGPDENPYM